MFLLRTLRALRFLYMGPIILVILVIVNWMTYSGNWWVKWAALGIGIAWVLSLIRVAEAAIVAGGLIALIRMWRKR